MSEADKLKVAVLTGMIDWFEFFERCREESEPQAEEQERKEAA